MLFDPLAGFANGLGTGLSRMFWAVVAILAGSLACLVALGSEASWRASDVLIPPLLGLGLWGIMGGWFFFGLVALLLMVSCAWAYVQERGAKGLYFAVFTSATVYCSAICVESSRNRLGQLLAIYAGCAVVYWVVPWAMERFRNRNTAPLP